METNEKEIFERLTLIRTQLMFQILVDERRQRADKSTPTQNFNLLI